MEKKIDAFTILEVTLVMLLAGICISIAFTAMGMVRQSYHRYDEKNKKIAACMLLQKLLQQDFLKSTEILNSEEGIIAKSDSGVITYHFAPEFILRKQYGLANDTLFITSQDLQKVYNGTEVSVDNRINRLSFRLLLHGNFISYDFEKQYSAEEVINKEN